MAEPMISYAWHAIQWQQLAQLHEEQRLPHALLLGGAPGIGKLRFARALLATLLCEQPKGFQACGACQACQLHASGSHPDLRELTPEEGKRQIGIDQVRSLQQFTAQSAHRDGGRKLALIYPAEAMNAYTANAVLKTLEEPAGDTVLILLSHSPSQLLPTIRSRCMQMNFPLPVREQALAWLETQLGGGDSAERLLDESGGRPLAALQLFEADGLAQWQRQDEALAALVAGRKDAVALAEEWQEQDSIELLDWWLRRLSSLIRHKSAGQPMTTDIWLPFAVLPDERLHGFMDEVLSVRAKLLRGAALNKRLLLEKLLLDWQSMLRSHV